MLFLLGVGESEAVFKIVYQVRVARDADKL